MEAAHAHRLIHRDIKPGNVMVVANRAGNLDVKLIDFGLAKGTATEVLDAARITRSEDFVGSPAFASPEQCEIGKLDTRSDIYSLGVTLWYLLSGKRPFSGMLLRQGANEYGPYKTQRNGSTLQESENFATWSLTPMSDGKTAQVRLQAFMSDQTAVFRRVTE